MSVSLTKETVGVVHVTITRRHPNPISRVRDCARASFHNLPASSLSITAVRPEPHDALRNFAPAVIYTVTAFRPAQSI
jgi:hypothetical protein